jgi:hypothetical protein
MRTHSLTRTHNNNKTTSAISSYLRPPETAGCWLALANSLQSIISFNPFIFIFIFFFVFFFHSLFWLFFRERTSPIIYINDDHKDDDDDDDATAATAKKKNNN